MGPRRRRARSPSVAQVNAPRKLRPAKSAMTWSGSTSARSRPEAWLRRTAPPTISAKPSRMRSSVRRTSGSSAMATARERSFSESGTSGSVTRCPSARAMLPNGSSPARSAASSSRRRIASACSSSTARKSACFEGKWR